MAGKLLPIMWPAYLAALLLSLPAPPAAGREPGARSTLDRAHQGEDVPSRPLVASLPDIEAEDEDGSDQKS